MPKHILNWKAIKTKNIRGSDINSPLPNHLDFLYRGTLLTRILDMKKKHPISLEDAGHMVTQKRLEAFEASSLEEWNWLLDHFIEWISDQGYHIELTGDEFEPVAMSDKVS